MSSQPHPSLLSLSLVAAQSDPLPPLSPTQSEAAIPSSLNGNGGRMKTRRLSSASQTRKRMNGAREAGIRNSVGAISAFAALSLSSSPPPPSITTITATANTPAPATPQQPIASSLPTTAPLSSFIPPPPSTAKPHITTHPSGHQSLNGILSVGALESVPPPSSHITGSKKKGTIFRCESCSKVYRHPSCLVKHRWEHSPHWKEANKFLLSKHQQVQLLEAAAILSHITPSKPGSGVPATSLPDDRSLWPTYLSAYVPPRPAKDDGEVDIGEDEDEELDDDEEVVEDDDDASGGEMDMEFDNDDDATATRATFLGPVSSSVPTTSFLNSAMGIGMTTRSRTTTAASTASATTNHHHHGSRSRSRSVSKSIHRNVIMTVRGIPPSSKDQRMVDDTTSPPPPATNGMTTLRPGLIAVPSSTAASSSPSASSLIIPKSESGVGQLNSYTASVPSSWGGVKQHSTPSSPIPTTATMSNTASSRTSYNTNNLNTTATSFSLRSTSLSIPRSSLRSSSSFLETDEAPTSLEEEEEEDGAEPYLSSGSEGKKKKKEMEWDGEEMEMELEMGY